MSEQPSESARQAIVPDTAAGRRFDAVVAELFPEYSRSRLTEWIKAGDVLLDGAQVRPRDALRGGEVVTLNVVLETQTDAQPEDIPLDVLFEDEHLLVINKPVGLVVHPAAGHWQGTLMNGLLAHHAGAVLLPRAGIVHRLDKDTSGLMVVGKTLQACTALTRAIAAREVHRQYRALAWGQPPEALRIEAPIGRDLVSRVRMAVSASGKPAMTDVRCLGSLEAVVADAGKTPAGGVVSAVECTLHTGRTHQIRVHLASRGWPLLADALYGGTPALGLTRQALHAARLKLVHPVLGQELAFEAPLPPDMATAWAQVVHNGLSSV